MVAFILNSPSRTLKEWFPWILELKQEKQTRISKLSVIVKETVCIPLSSLVADRRPLSGKGLRSY